MAQADIRAFLTEVAGPDAAARASADYLTQEARRHIPAGRIAEWVAACRSLEQAGLGNAVILAYVRQSPVVARIAGADAAIALADHVKTIAFTAGRAAAQALPAAAAAAASRLDSADRYKAWLAVVLRFAPHMKESVEALLRHTDHILSRLDVSRFEAWTLGGIRIAGGDKERRRLFFAFGDPAAERSLLRESGEVVFSDLERRLKTYLTALWRVRVAVREAAVGVGRPIPRRASFDAGVVRMPASFPGVPQAQANDLFRAALAHIAAHLMYSGPRFRPGSLKPLQIALVSLIEDARVEHLAMRDFPGLRRLWLPFHAAAAAGTVTAPGLMARLSRALIDPDYDDDDDFVAKGRRMFFEREADWEDPTISRGIGNLLGNDLGQMRVQFNAKTYVVEPAYRDDNAGLWDFEDAPPEDMDVAEMFESVRIAPKQEDEPEPDDSKQDNAPDTPINKARPSDSTPEEEGVPVARYPEWDYAVAQERPEWTTLVEYPPAPGPAAVVERILEGRPDIVNRITALVRSARVSRPVRLRRQPEGDRLDLDACIDAVITQRHGDTPDPNVYMTSARKFRDLSVLVLLDVSQSTNDRVKGSRETVLELEQEATALLAHAMNEVGDPFAIHAFCSNTREEVRYMRIKDFQTPYDNMAKSYLAGLTGQLSTRLGAAMRHAGEDLRNQMTHRKLLLVVTDGEPSDIDVQDRKYLVEDARKAVASLSQQGIDVFCVGLDSGGDSYLTRIFGRRNALQIDRLSSLPEKLPMLYFRLTA
ncbi:MAG: VWA domain-containing protein [Alphaproteobacteria bacterium]|nr:VWA domain-containing protein [Alphaproteobacteria bacterium]MDX5370444.1 VWA domain-containing protein [Alphaproteobacteria bacterium]MDX5464950.1 VWA domain-containing protein [Alphaproteobacteria bacterium]